VLRLRLAVLAHVPLADGLGDVPGGREQLGDRDLTGEPARHPVHRGSEQPVTHRQSPGHDRRPRRRARRLGVARRQQETVAGETVDVRCRRAGHHAAAVAAEVAPADVVHEHEQHVRFLAGAGLQRGELPVGGAFLLVVDEAGFLVLGDARGLERDRILRHGVPRVDRDIRLGR